MNFPWFQILMASDRFKKSLHAFHIFDNSIISSKDELAYRLSCRVRPLLDISTVCMHYYMPGQAVAIESLIAGQV